MPTAGSNTVSVQREVENAKSTGKCVLSNMVHNPTLNPSLATELHACEDIGTWRVQELSSDASLSNFFRLCGALRLKAFVTVGAGDAMDVVAATRTGCSNTRSGNNTTRAQLQLAHKPTTRDRTAAGPGHSPCWLE